MYLIIKRRSKSKLCIIFLYVYAVYYGSNMTGLINYLIQYLAFSLWSKSIFFLHNKGKSYKFVLRVLYAKEEIKYLWTGQKIQTEDLRDGKRDWITHL